MESTYPQRKHQRLPGYDYGSPGYYFLTLCTRDKKAVLGHIAGTTVQLTRVGEIVKHHIELLAGRYDCVCMDKYIIMPNHIHMMLQLTERINPLPTPRPNVPNIVGKWKAGITRELGSASIWQETYYDHIVQNEVEYQKIWSYIDANPLKWQEDVYFA